MGFLQRRVAKSAEAFWTQARPVMDRSEEPVFYAHMRCQDSRLMLPGTLFLTDKQVIWRAHAPGLPRGAGFEYPVQALRGIGTAEGQNGEAGEFALIMHAPGREGPAMLLFGPARPKSRASILLAQEMKGYLHDAWKAYGESVDPSTYDQP